MIFRGVTEIGQSLLSDNLEINFAAFLQWSLLSIGAFENVRIPSSGAYGGDKHRLRLVDSPYHASGQVWEAFRNDWVWESGIPYHTQPIRVSGVYVNGTFHSLSATGAYAHTVDYPLGQVRFSSAISPSSVVTCEYSYRYVQVHTADHPSFQQIQTNSFRVDDNTFLLEGSGAWHSFSQNRLQLPALVIEAAPTVALQYGREVGSLASVTTKEVRVHVLTEERWWYKQLNDLFLLQYQKRLSAFDKNLLDQKGLFPLLFDGSISSSGKMYPDWIKPTGEGGAWYNQYRLIENRTVERPKMGAIHFSTVRLMVEVDLV
jgi:hypothetical protein